MAGYIGLFVKVTLSDYSTLTGTIQDVDAQRNLLILRPAMETKSVKIERSRISSISVVSDSPHAESKLIPAIPDPVCGAPDASNLPEPTSNSKVGPRGGSNEAKVGSREGNFYKTKNKKAASGKVQTASVTAERAQPSSSSSSVPAEDFDFEASLKSFDKARIWEEIRASDTTDPAGRLVAHNRLPSAVAAVRVQDPSSSSSLVADSRNASPAPRGRALNGSLSSSDKQRKLRPDENVLSPSPPPAPASAEQTAEKDVLQLENAALRRRLTILQKLSGFALEPNEDPSSTGQEIEYQCSLIPSHNAASTQPLPPLHFHLTTTLDSSDPKLRFKPSSSSQTQNPSSAIPPKYHRELGLRLDNDSARVFLQRLRDSIDKEPSNECTSSSIPTA